VRQNLISKSTRKEMRKMKKLLVVVIAGMFLLGLSGIGMAQTGSDNHTVTIVINEIAEINVTTASITLTVTAPGTPGADPQGDTDNTTYLQYTSTVASGQTRTIDAKLDAAMLSGLSLAVQATPGSGEGTSAGSVTLSTTDQSVITSIGSCATGTGGTDGAQVTYTLSVTDPTQLTINAGANYTVTYTLTDDA